MVAPSWRRCRSARSKSCESLDRGRIGLTISMEILKNPTPCSHINQPSIIKMLNRSKTQFGAVIIAALAVTSFMATTARAQNPHFLNCSASGPSATGDLQSCFKIAGLGSNQSLTITASASANAVYACRNKGQQCPNAANKVSVSGTVTAQGTFTSGKNGQITGCLTVEPPDTTLTCPGGQKLVLVSVSYTNVAVSAQGAGDCSTTGSFAQNYFPNCP
jgi:hypothetical protein